LKKDKGVSISSSVCQQAEKIFHRPKDVIHCCLKLYLRKRLKCRSWFCKLGQGQRICIFNEAPHELVQRPHLEEQGKSSCKELINEESIKIPISISKEVS
jgi:hypothetical protein